ncbi:hypothetical protein HL653_13020 [Sphingomonas sp. AP4-R1]|uniref:copper resistance CopC family protein n=1 Tax=Sphingomonas sp. AP4-R1 TaxID=2735134 RepID=UPI001493AA5F|nr:copper resistance protein CopC [Sphingomonas sp. AP4-R1]QJU58561.1 hypothetical protein HL653_13020 [Sphingomonas sp. AP4-R1]
MRKILMPAAILSLFVAGPAIGQPSLTGSNPSAGSTTPRTDRLRLLFSEPIDARASTVQLVMTDMPGMPHHGAMRMAAIDVKPGKDGRSLDIGAKAPFPAGTYRLDWTIASKADRSRASGQLTFSLETVPK